MFILLLCHKCCYTIATWISLLTASSHFFLWFDHDIFCSIQPTRQPSALPSCQPSSQPSAQPVVCPSMQPSVQPSEQPSMRPSVQPTCQPTQQVCPSSCCCCRLMYIVLFIFAEPMTLMPSLFLISLTYPFH